MATMEEWKAKPPAERIARLTRMPDELAEAIRGRSEALLVRRPDEKNWAAKEIVCHLRDTEELFGSRFEILLAAPTEPTLLGLDPDRWAEERQYLRNDALEALAAFRRRRLETLALLGRVQPADWARAGNHVVRGRMTMDDILTLVTWHDDNHLDQLRRALEGRA